MTLGEAEASAPVFYASAPAVVPSAPVVVAEPDGMLGQAGSGPLAPLVAPEPLAPSPMVSQALSRHGPPERRFTYGLFGMMGVGKSATGDNLVTGGDIVHASQRDQLHPGPFRTSAGQEFELSAVTLEPELCSYQRANFEHPELSKVLWHGVDVPGLMDPNMPLDDWRFRLGTTLREVILCSGDQLAQREAHSIAKLKARLGDGSDELGPCLSERFRYLRDLHQELRSSHGIDQAPFPRADGTMRAVIDLVKQTLSCGIAKDYAVGNTVHYVHNGNILQGSVEAKSEAEGCGTSYTLRGTSGQQETVVQKMTLDMAPFADIEALQDRLRRAENVPGIDAFLFVIRLDHRWSPDCEKAWKAFKQMFGEDVKKQTIVVLTHATVKDPETYAEHVKTNMKDQGLRGVLEEVEWRVYGIDNTNKNGVARQTEAIHLAMDKLRKSKPGPYAGELWQKAQADHDNLLNQLRNLNKDMKKKVQALRERRELQGLSDIEFEREYGKLLKLAERQREEAELEAFKQSQAWLAKRTELKMVAADLGLKAAYYASLASMFGGASYAAGYAASSLLAAHYGKIFLISGAMGYGYSAGGHHGHGHAQPVQVIVQPPKPPEPRGWFRWFW